MSATVAVTEPVAVNWDLHRRLRTEGRLNLLFRLSEPLVASRLQNDWTGDAESRPNVLPFVSRAQHLAWRTQWTQGRFVIRSPGPELRAAILRQDEIYRQADAAWALRHGPVAGGARLLPFSEHPFDDAYLTEAASQRLADGRNGAKNS